MPLDGGDLELYYSSSDGSEVLEDFIKYIANKGLLDYKRRIHIRQGERNEKAPKPGGKVGESLWTHIMTLVTLVEKLRPLFHLDTPEMSCLLLALVVHDLNKDEEYNKRPDGKGLNYANAAAKKNIRDKLEKLKVGAFFPEWETYIDDIVYLAHAHQEGALVATVYDRRELNECRLELSRLEGPLKYLMKAADVSDNSHSGDFSTRHEKHIRDKLLGHINSAFNEDGQARRYRFIGHHLAEQRGLMTNIMHNALVAFFQETYGEEACIDLLYHPEGVDYLLDRRIPLQWTAATLHIVAERVGERFAQLQSHQLTQFIKASPSGIGVDDAAIQSGASLADIFTVIQHIVERKQYRLEWREQRNTFLRNDLVETLESDASSADLKERVQQLLQERTLLPPDDATLQRGEFAAAYRNFLKDHRAEQLKAIKQDAWRRIARLFQLSEAEDALYACIDPYRRGYFLARDLPPTSIGQMKDDALSDLEQLEAQATAAQAARKPKKAKEPEQELPDDEAQAAPTAFDSAYLVDYLQRHLEVWDSLAEAQTRSVQSIDFAESLRRYADPKQPHTQCCYCGSALKAGEWMALQVPRNIGVQSFSNRLEAGSIRDPKRNVCDICRTQFILEKLAWVMHSDKQGSERATFYLHLFPYSYYTRPLLSAWWEGVSRLRDEDHHALLLDTKDFFQRWEQLQGEVTPRYYTSFSEGVSIPTFSDAVSNTPVLPLIMTGSSYGMQFLSALEKTLLLARWFDSRVILSRMPVPSLNLANEYIGAEPVALLVENPPQSLSWLLPQTTLTRSGVDALCSRLGTLHQLVDLLMDRNDTFDERIYDLVSAAADDPLALHYKVDRLIEQNVARKKGKTEYQAMKLSHSVAPLLRELTQ